MKYSNIVEFQISEHRAVFLIVTVKNDVGRCVIFTYGAAVIHKNGAYRAGGLFPAMVQIISIVTFCTRG